MDRSLIAEMFERARVEEANLARTANSAARRRHQAQLWFYANEGWRLIYTLPSRAETHH